jgi:RNA polymerase sigma-70 factor (ECF subfamily)
LETFNTVCKVVAWRVNHLQPHPDWSTTMDLSDPLTFSRLYGEHRRAVHATAYRVLGNSAQAQDVVQDVFLRVWRNPGRFDARRGELAGYLRMMARSRAVDVWREGRAAGRAGERLKVAVATDAARHDERPEHPALESTERFAVHEALRRLPEPQREALVLAYWGGLTTNQIAARAGVPLGTAKSRVRLGLARLRTELAGAMPDLAAAA